MVEHPNLAFRREYTLLAQTPMIHFQPNQAGAVLRPSEVKPKLDRYLRRMYGKEVPRAWLVSEQTQALNYQMRIIACGSDKSNGLTIDQCKAYFGNMGSGTPPKGLVFRDCALEINCFIPELLELIDQHIGGFFVLHNFGTRQSKGFGGFLIEGRNSAVDIRETVQRQCSYYFYTTFRGTPDAGSMLSHALAVYTVLKNGSNQTRYRDGRYGYPDRYIKGYAVRRFLPEKVGSDKAFIKSQVLPSQVRRSKDDLGPYESYTFIRAMLGMADHYEFRDDMRNGGINFNGKLRPKTVNVVHYEGTQVVDGQLQIPLRSIKENLGIKRFRSPIFIKICGNRIFFILEDSWKEMQDQIFLMMPDTDYKEADRCVKFNRYADAQRIFQSAKYIRTPAEFDPAAFMSGFVDYFHDSRATLARFADRGAGSELHDAAALVLEKGGSL